LASTVFDSVLFRGMFGTAEMRDIFSDEALVGRYLEAEVALARAQARVGVIPNEGAAAIEAASRAIRIDFDKLRHETEIVGYPILPLVHQLSSAAGEAGRFVHWGATTQDIMDTGNVLQIRSALAIVERDLRELRSILAAMARKYRDTPMAGRTHLQQALPVTFGYKAAVWLSSIDRHIERIEQARPRVLVGEFSGAAGTLASIGEGGLQMQKLFCEELGLNQPSITWHVARDGIAEAVTLLGLVTGTLGKIATDVMMMSATEFGEVSEPFVPGPGRLVHHAAEAQSDLQRVDARRRQGHPSARRHHARRHDPRFRARHRPLAPRMGLVARKFSFDGIFAGECQVHAGRPRRSRTANAGKSRSDPRPHRR
jgi:3-carboxy-cis,cis-muconate cycloisomerase